MQLNEYRCYNLLFTHVKQNNKKINKYTQKLLIFLEDKKLVK